VLLFNSTIDFDLVNLQSCNSTHFSSLMSWLASINKRLKLFSTKSEDQRKHHSLRFARNSSNLLNNEISLELRQSLYLRSKSHSESASMILLCQCDDLSIHIALFISELNYYVHMQLVSLLQRRDSNRFFQWVNQFSHSESVTMTCSTVSLLQWRVWYWSHHRVSHLIVSLLERHSKWVCYKDRQ